MFYAHQHTSGRAVRLPGHTDRWEGLEGSKCVAGHMKSAGRFHISANASNYDVEDEPGTWSPAQQRDTNHCLGKIKEMHHAYATVSSLYASAINS